MLTIERGNQLSGVEIAEGYDLHFRKAECIFYDLGNAAQLWFVYAAAQDGCDFDFCLYAVGAEFVHDGWLSRCA